MTTMNAEQIALLRRSFAELQALAGPVAQHFYARLFEIDPALRPLFKGDMTAQGGKLMTMLGLALGLLEEPAKLQAALQRLGQRHVAYGVQARHYDSVGRALLDTLAALLGPGFTPPLQAAWAGLYRQVAQTMQEAAAALPPASLAA